MTIKKWVKKHNGWPEGDERFAESILEEVSREDPDSDLVCEAAEAYLLALQNFQAELEALGFEPG